eukprot:Selendium_serpulae@DN6517_c2_g1_i10.p1
MERARVEQKDLYLTFVDLQKAYDSLNRPALYAILKHYGVLNELVELIKELHTDTSLKVKVEGETSEPFGVTTGVKQRCVMAPMLFNVYIDYILRRVVSSAEEKGLEYEFDTEYNFRRPHWKGSKHRIRLTHVLFADDTVLLSTKHPDDCVLYKCFVEGARRFGLLLNEYIMTTWEPESQQTAKVSLKVRDG